jgi:hypothetical protein
LFLPLGELEQGCDQILRRAFGVEYFCDEARMARGRPAPDYGGSANPDECERPDDVDSADHARERPVCISPTRMRSGRHTQLEACGAAGLAAWPSVGSEL